MRDSAARRVPRVGATLGATTSPHPEGERRRWLLLIHQVPPKPDYLRVKVRRRLERLGAIPLKNAVYVLPHTPAAVEDFQWLLREIVADGGEGSLCDAAFVAGVSDESLVAAFHEARDADYREIAADAAGVGLASVAPAAGEDPIAEGEAPASVNVLRSGSAGALARLQRRLAEVVAIDFLAAPGRAAAERAVAAAGERLADAQLAGARRHAQPADARAGAAGGAVLRGRTWVTRAGVFVDRMASAWLIRRFIDPDAQFRFVPPAGYRPAAGELRFDMFEAEYTHEGDRCTFETLLARFDLADPALHAVAEIVHDIDLKDAKYGRPETAGVERLVAGIAAAHADDPARLERAAHVFDDLLAAFRASAPEP